MEDREDEPMPQPSVTTVPESARPARPAAAGRELRRFRRLPLELPVTLRNALGERCAAILVDVSPTGLMLGCDESTLRCVQATPGRELILEANLELPAASGPRRLSLGLRLVHVTRSADSAQFRLGFDYLALRPRAQRVLAEFFGGPQATGSREAHRRAG